MTSTVLGSYENNSEYWRKDKPKLQGDLEQRPHAVEMLGDVNNKHILEAGCGSGYVARMIAEKGAKVTGVDNSFKMLKIAEDFEKENTLGINYCYGDITRYLHCQKEIFDGIACVGVVHHLNPGEYVSFLKEASYVLKKDSPLVISLVHPSLFYQDSPARNDERCSTKFFPLEDKSMDTSQRFGEELYDVEGKRFNSILWYHPSTILFNSLIDMGFRIDQVNECFFRKEHRITPAWGEAYGYPTHIQIKAVKKGGNAQ